MNGGKGGVVQCRAVRPDPERTRRDRMWHDIEFARVLIAEERRATAAALRRERAFRCGLLLLTGALLALVLWGMP